MIQEFQQLQFPSSEGEEVRKPGKRKVGDVVSQVSVRCLPMLVGVIGVRSGGFPKHEVA